MTEELYRNRSFYLNSFAVCITHSLLVQKTFCTIAFTLPGSSCNLKLPRQPQLNLHKSRERKCLESTGQVSLILFNSILYTTQRKISFRPILLLYLLSNQFAKGNELKLILLSALQYCFDLKIHFIKWRCCEANKGNVYLTKY